MVIFCCQGFLRRFRDTIRVHRIESRVPRIRENYHRVPRIRDSWVPRIREIESLQVHIGYLTFSLTKTGYNEDWFAMIRRVARGEAIALPPTPKIASTIFRYLLKLLMCKSKKYSEQSTQMLGTYPTSVLSRTWSKQNGLLIVHD